VLLWTFGDTWSSLWAIVEDMIWDVNIWGRHMVVCGHLLGTWFQMHWNMLWKNKSGQYCPSKSLNFHPWFAILKSIPHFFSLFFLSFFLFVRKITILNPWRSQLVQEDLAPIAVHFLHIVESYSICKQFSDNCH
jgi:quinol-cytochrome oxidoreductase complex cytochrome b subunit